MTGITERKRGPSQTSNVWLLLFASALGVCLVAFLARNLLPTGAGARLVAACFQLTAVGVAGYSLVIKLRHHNTPPLGNLLTLWLFYMVATFGWASLGLLEPGHISRAGIDHVQAAIALDAVTIGTVGMLFGWLTARRALLRESAGLGGALRLAQGPPARDREGVFLLGLILFIAGLAATIIMVRRGIYGYFFDPQRALTEAGAVDQLLRQVAAARKYGLLVMSVQAFSMPGYRMRVVVCAVFLVDFILSFSSGMKEEVVVACAAVTFAYWVAQRRLPWKTVCLGILFVSIVLFPLNSAYRSALRTDAGRLDTEIALTQTGSLASWTLQEAQRNDTGFISLSERLRQIDNVALIQVKTPSAIPYRNWDRLVVGPAAGLVPRAVWPDKPVMTEGLDFGRDYYGRQQGSSAFAVTTMGDLLRHGGLPVLVIGMFFLGLLSGGLDTLAIPFQDRRLIIIFFALAVPIVKGEADFVSLTVALVQTFVVAVTATLFVHKWGRRDRLGRSVDAAGAKLLREGGPQRISGSTD